MYGWGALGGLQLWCYVTVIVPVRLFHVGSFLGRVSGFWWPKVHLVGGGRYDWLCGSDQV